MSPRLKEAPDGRSIVFEDRPLVLPAIFGAAATFLAGHAVVQYQALLDGEKEALGLIFSALFAALAAALFFRRDYFVFDLDRRRLSWRKWSLFKRSAGAVDFAEIAGVTVESMSGSEGGASYRIALRTPAGALPLTETYSGDNNTWQPMAARLRTVLGMTAAAGDDDDLRALVAQGRHIDAIRQLREARDLSLTDAKAEIDRLRREQEAVAE